MEKQMEKQWNLVQLRKIGMEAASLPKIHNEMTMRSTELLSHDALWAGCIWLSFRGQFHKFLVISDMIISADHASNFAAGPLDEFTILLLYKCPPFV